MELPTENEMNFGTEIQVKNPSEYSNHCQQLNIIWLFLSNLRFTTPAKGERTVNAEDTTEIDQNDPGDDSIILNDSQENLEVPRALAHIKHFDFFPYEILLFYVKIN